MNRYMRREYDQDYIFNLMYPGKLFIVEVNYSTKDVAISEIRYERGAEPKEKDNSRGFTENFSTYEAAERRARNIAEEMGYSF